MGSTETHSTKQTLLLVGAGPIGLTAASAAASDGVARVIGVIDPDEQARQNAGEILACTTYPSLADLEGECPDVALVEFISSTAAAAPTVMSLVANGCWRRHRRDRSESRFRDGPARHDGCHCRTRRAHRHCGPAAGHTDKTRSTGRQDGLRLAGRRVPRTGRSGTTGTRRPRGKREPCRRRAWLEPTPVDLHPRTHPRSRPTRKKPPVNQGVSVVAGAGFEPATFGL